ncbi:MAG: FHA domain-containing protein [Syntrophomonadaceae bacterium]|nr:FHA domain-containing protein [Syntrophomonadaceae bacterium]
MEPSAILIIEQGEPHSANTEIILNAKEMIIGRPWRANHPDIALTNPQISRRHAVIKFEDGYYFITDLASKHGTKVNNIALEPHQPFSLCHGDSIDLARGSAFMTFKSLFESENDDTTIDLVKYNTMQSLVSPAGLNINVARREVLLDNRPLNLSGKDLELLLQLYMNRNKAVSYDNIRRTVWPERPVSVHNNIPDVGSDEINALVYRLRKRLGHYGSLIVTIPRFGYRLDL